MLTRPTVRVVSLVPSVTETLLAWASRRSRCTRFCEQPGLPTVGGTKDPDVAAIVALAPDLVVVNDEENRREDADAPRRGRPGVHVMTVAVGRRRRPGAAPPSPTRSAARPPRCRAHRPSSTGADRTGSGRSSRSGGGRG